MNEQALHKYIKENARPVELAWYNYFFEKGTSEEVVKELSAYQNPDGGFGHGLEADYWNPNSSPIATNDAIIRLHRVDAIDKDSDMIKGIIKYLKSGDSFDKEKRKWYFAIESSRDYPHAIWWVPEEGSDGISGYNPTASLATFMVCYGEDDGFFADIVKDAFSFLENTKEMGGDSLKCYLLSYAMLKENRLNDIVDLDKAKVTLQKRMYNEICKDISKYGVEYVTTPSDFFTDSYWSFATPEMEEIIESELSNLVNIQLEDGGFDIFWQWYTDYKEFEEARNMWRPRVTIEKLLFWTAAKDTDFRKQI